MGEGREYQAALSPERHRGGPALPGLPFWRLKRGCSPDAVCFLSKQFDYWVHPIDLFSFL